MATFRAVIPDFVPTVKAESELGGDAEKSAETTDYQPILDVNGVLIDPVWAAEFRGFFWGEGTLVVRSNRPLAKRLPHVQWKGYSHSMSASIGLRSDDGDVLREFQARLGGTLRYESYRDGSGKTILRWYVGLNGDCLRVAAVLAGGSPIPFGKSRQLALWTEAIRLKASRGAKAASRYTVEQGERLRRIEETLRDMRKWQG